ncbi:MAG: antiterminator Q family protein [Acidobacteriota bacterium]
MRRILVEQARRKGRLEHGGELQRVAPDNAALAIAPPDDRVLAVDRAVSRLEESDPRQGQIVNLRYFAGLTLREIAELLGLSLSTIEREWRFTKTWLQVELTEALAVDDRK